MKLRQAVLPSTSKFFIPKLSLNNSGVQISTAYGAPLTQDIKRLIKRVFMFLAAKVMILKETFSGVVHDVGDFTTQHVVPAPGGVRRRLSRFGSSFRYNFPKKKFSKILFILLLLVSLILAVRAVYSFLGGGSSQKSQVLGAKASETINKELTFPLRNEQGEEVSRISYMVEKAELMDQILVRGEKATAISGRTFLILTIKIKNDFDRSIEINTKDYIRLKIIGNDELLAPDIHNDPVTVQAISTKYTRVGFPINDSDRQLTLQLGEINGPKESIEVKF